MRSAALTGSSACAQWRFYVLLLLLLLFLFLCYFSFYFLQFGAPVTLGVCELAAVTARVFIYLFLFIIIYVFAVKALLPTVVVDLVLLRCCSLAVLQ
jgi:hypothetical protein